MQLCCTILVSNILLLLLVWGGGGGGLGEAWEEEGGEVTEVPMHLCCTFLVSVCFFFCGGRRCMGGEGGEVEPS